MRVRNSRVALLTDYEVLSLVNELEAKLRDGAAKAAAAEAEAEAVAAEAEVQGHQLGTNGVNGMQNDQYTSEDRHNQTALKIIPHNLRQIQYSMLEALGTTQRPCHHQNDASIPAFLDAIFAWERGKSIPGLEEVRKSYDVVEKDRRLNKGERLMLINHAPTTLVALHTMIEEIEWRFTLEERQDLLAIIQLTLPLDTEAIRQDNELAMARSAAQHAAMYEVVGEDVDMGEGYEGQEGYEDYQDDGIVDDIEELENEGRGEGAVDDEAKDED